MVSITTVLVGLFAVALVGLWKLWFLLIKFVFFLGTICLEEYILKPLHYQHRFPRSKAETLEHPRKLFKILVGQGVISKRARYENTKELRKIDTEPAKNATSVPLAITFSVALENGKRSLETINVFVKFQTGKGMPIWMQAIRAAAEPGVAREVDFYNKLSKVAEIKSPKAYYADKLPAFNLVFVVLEHVDLHCGRYKVIPDHSFSSPVMMENLLTKVAKMHSKFLGVSRKHKASSWIPATVGLQFCEWVRTLGSKNQPEAFLKVFVALEGYFKPHALTVVHGDCRPGNMMFNLQDEEDLLFADFEAVNAAPPIWDFTYATIIGLPVDVRREEQEGLFEKYLTKFMGNVHEGQKKSLRTREEYHDDLLLLTLVLFYVSITITKLGAWDNQGNTDTDLKEWRHRVSSAIQDIPTDKISKLLKLDSALIDEVKQLN